MFQIGKGMGHVRLARQERLFKDHGITATDPADALNICRKIAHQNLWAKGRLAQFGMGQKQIVDPFCHMVGKLVGQRPANAGRGAVCCDQIDARDFRLFAAIQRKAGAGQGSAGGNGGKAVAFVEPLGLHAHAARRGATALQPHAKHLHAVGQGFRAIRLGMHRVAGGGRTQMGQARAGQVQMCRIRMGDRQGQPAGRGKGCQVHRFTQTPRGNHQGQRAAGCQRL